MSFMNKKMGWTNAEFIPLKLAIGSAYLLIGAYFSSFVLQYKIVFIILFLVTVIYSLYLWWQKMNLKNEA